MTLKELFILKDSGLLLFHHRFSGEEEKDPTLTSGLLAAVFHFAQQVEQDTIDFIRMRKVAFIFRRSKGLLFVISLDSQVNPLLFEEALPIIEHKFLRQFPDATLDHLPNMAEYDPFREELTSFLKPLEMKARLVNETAWMLGIREEQLIEWTLEDIALAVMHKVLITRGEILQKRLHAGTDEIKDVAEEIIHGLGLPARFLKIYPPSDVQVSCGKHRPCKNNPRDCFCRSVFLSILELINQ